MRRRLTIMLGCALPSFVACSALVSLNGLTGDGVQDAAPDVAMHDAIASGDANQPGTDATTGDAGTDGGADATPFCKLGTHAFCADFDEGALMAGWTDQRVDSPGSASLSTDRASSLPGSFLSQMPRMAANDPTRYAVLERRFDGAWRRVIVDFDIYIALPDWLATDVNAGVITISLNSSDQSYGMALSQGQSYTTIGANGAPSMNAAPIPNNTWVHAHVDYDPEVKLTAHIGTVMYSVPLGALSGQGGSPNVTVGLGISGYNHPAPAWKVYYDNVTIDLP